MLAGQPRILLVFVPGVFIKKVYRTCRECSTCTGVLIATNMRSLHWLNMSSLN